MSTKENQAEQLHTDVFSLSQELSTLVIREHEILQDELQQVGHLVGDAVKDLIFNFTRLKELAENQADIIAHSLNKDDATIDDNVMLDKIVDVTHQTKACVSNIIVALQFDDIIQQLTTHSSQRSEQLKYLFTDISIKLNNNGCVQTQALMHKLLQDIYKDINKYRNVLENENPVKQDNMKKGKIELFK